MASEPKEKLSTKTLTSDELIMPIQAHQWLKHRHSGDFASSTAPLHYPVDLMLEPTHTRIALHVDIEQRQAKGTVSHTVRANAADQRELSLHAVSLDIEQISDLSGAKMSYEYDGLTLKLRWEDAIALGEERVVQITYSVTDPASGLFFSAPDAQYPQAALYAATDHETERARHWLPTIDLPNVRCTLEFELTAKAELTILANGELSREVTHEDGTKTAFWRLDYPCPSYLICFAIGDFTRAEDGEFEGKPIAYFGAKDKTPEDLMRSFGRTKEMLAWMVKKLDQPFPFPKYYQFALPAFGGAMENISLVSWDDIFVLDETLALEWTWLLDQINVHEMAHSYFGDAIVCRDYAHAWLKESWATYIETCWLEDSKGADERDYDFWRNQHAYFNEADHSYKRPIVTNKFDSSWRMYDRHLYPGGAARLHMLRKWLTDEVFWAGVQRYVARFMGKTVETPDFRRAMEEVSGRSLVRFFEQWIYSAGYPDLKVEFSWDEDHKRATWTITQQQVKASEGKEPTFVIPCKVGWSIGGEQHTHSLTLEQEKQQLSLTLPAKPDHVRFDPLNEVVHKLDFNPGQDQLIHQLTHAPDVIGRIVAGKELAKAAKRQGLEALDAAYTEEPFWGVRQQWAIALGEVNTKQAATILARWVSVEQDALVQESLISAAGKLREPEIKAALIARLEAKSLPYRATMAAYVALGGYGAAAPVALLQEAANTATGYGDWPQQGAAKALAMTRDPAHTQQLKALATYGGSSIFTRRVVLPALGQLSNYMERAQKEQTIDLLEDLLRDPNDRVRTAAASALRSAKASRAYDKIAAWAQTLSHQEKVDALDLLKGLSTAQDPKLTALEGELDKVKKDYRDLLDRLEKLEQPKDSGEPKAQ